MTLSNDMLECVYAWISKRTFNRFSFPGRSNVTGESDLTLLHRDLSPFRHPGEYVFSVLPEKRPLFGAEPVATFREEEGLTLVLEKQQAEAAGLTYDFPSAWITLKVQSRLSAVGLTAAVSTALAGAGIPCNMFAGFHHDHIFVPVEQAERAVSILTALADDRGFDDHSS